MKRSILLFFSVLLLLSGCAFDGYYTQDELDSLVSEYEEKLSDLESEFEEKLSELESDYENKLKQAKDEADEQYQNGKSAGLELGYNNGFIDGSSEVEDAYDRGYNDGIASVKNQSVTTTGGRNPTKTTDSDTTPVEQPKSYTVYITENGKKYHSDGCQYLWNSKISIDKTKAMAQGYTACSKCHP